MLADDVIMKQSITELIPSVNELHTITSPSGSDALIRGIKVICYGMPFYADWGLSQDPHISIRCHKTLSLNELIYTVLIDYAVYQRPNPVNNTLPVTTVEQVVAHFKSALNNASFAEVHYFKGWLTSLLRIKSRLKV